MISSRKFSSGSSVFGARVERDRTRRYGWQATEMTMVGVERLAAGDDKKDRAENGEVDPAVMDEKSQTGGWIESGQD